MSNYSKLSKVFLKSNALTIIILSFACFIVSFVCFRPVDMSDTQKYSVIISNVQRESGYKKVWATFETEVGRCYYEFLSNNIAEEFTQLQSLEGKSVEISVTETEGFPFVIQNENNLHVVEIKDANTGVVYFNADDLSNTRTIGRITFLIIGVVLLCFAIYKIVCKNKLGVSNGT